MNNKINNESIEFISKIYTKGKITFPFYRKISVLFLIIYTLLLLATFSIDGFDYTYLWKHVVTYTFCIIVLVKTNPINDYQNALAKITFEENGFSVSYTNSNEDYVQIPKKANMTILYKNIQDVKYDNLLQELFIQEGYDNTNIEAFFTIYIPECESKILISKITEKINIDKKIINEAF